MLFNSLDFLLFFPSVVVAFFLVPPRFQWVLLLVVSAVFYMAFVPWYILILLFLIVVDYCLGRLIEREERATRRKFLLIVSIVSNLGTLFLFKYFNFFNDNVAFLAHAIGWNYSIEALELILPLGLSFHVFQSMSYVIEVYRRNHPAERHLGIYALYVMFFPQLVAGPIERPQRLLPQLHEEHVFDYKRVMNGLTLMLWGFFKKLVIADQLALVVDHVYADPHHAPPALLLLATLFFAYQIYCDFSGYSDIAVGSARVLGFELMINFKTPYHSLSIAEFWKRWHISLSTWFRDYLYIPLGGNRVGAYRMYVNLLVVFIASGLWHGANWTFVIWGALHGAYLVLAIILRPWRESLSRIFRIDRFPVVGDVLSFLTTFLLVNVAWVFFRAHSVSDALYIVGNFPRGFLQLFDISVMRDEVLTGTALGVARLLLLLRIGSIVFMEIVEFYSARSVSMRTMLMSWRLPWRLSAYYFVIFLILSLGYFGAKSFIYYQF